jgi:hypothetical protein
MGSVDYIPTQAQRDAMVYCIDKYIKIYPKPVIRGPKNKKWYICVKLPDKAEICNTEELEENELWKTIWEYYEFYERKLKDNTLQR